MMNEAAKAIERPNALIPANILFCFKYRRAVLKWNINIVYGFKLKHQPSLFKKAKIKRLKKMEFNLKTADRQKMQEDDSYKISKM